MSSLQNLIFSAIENPLSLVWFPELTEQLVTYSWKNIHEKYELQEDNYSTEAIISWPYRQFNKHHYSFKSYYSE
ncbi:hypothetical protein METHB2_310003 [Candidatus Methylobacter favarea]|uniref:Uncharacterized protein n=1 Tax=Candidatus Methylobacter favarea TaxID=2707345 RepID=A0A8S0XSQ7_9GAMM|nr:hypothetical protein METHB2_310003 [Candidatus Methylobacter favarea]